jgi:hypothetical protein
MNKKIITVLLIMICLVIILLIKFPLIEKSISKIIYKKPQVNTTANINDNTTNKALVKRIKYSPSRIVISCNYKDVDKIMAKDIYLDKEIKNIVDFLNSIECEEQIEDKSEVVEWDFLIRIYDGYYKPFESVTFYKNGDKYAFKNDIAGIRITNETYEKFLDLYNSLESIEVHYSDIK